MGNDMLIRIVDAVLGLFALRCMSNKLEALIVGNQGLVGLGAADLVVSTLEKVSCCSCK